MVGLVAPLGQAEPAGQLLQSAGDCAPVSLRKLPASHAVGALAPAKQKEPVGQSTQAVAPLPDWNLPAAQLSQALAPLHEA